MGKGGEGKKTGNIRQKKKGKNFSKLRTRCFNTFSNGIHSYAICTSDVVCPVQDHEQVV